MTVEDPPVTVSIQRRIIAVVFTVLLVVIVWKIIDYRMQPPPPNAVAQPAER